MGFFRNRIALGVIPFMNYMQNIANVIVHTYQAVTVMGLPTTPTVSVSAVNETAYSDSETTTVMSLPSTSVSVTSP
jgi:hypothetical protein